MSALRTAPRRRQGTATADGDTLLHRVPQRATPRSPTSSRQLADRRPAPRATPPASLTGFEQHSTTAPAVTGTEADGAGTCATAGCHATTDLHALHVEQRRGAARTAARWRTATTPPSYGVKPTAKSCGATGACHTGDRALTQTRRPSTPRSRAPSAPSCHESADLQDRPRRRDRARSATATTTYPSAADRQARVHELPQRRPTSAPRLHAADPNHYDETTHTANASSACRTWPTAAAAPATRWSCVTST